MFEPKFYKCPKCGKMLHSINDVNTVPKCCDSDMELLVPNTNDGAFEKHVPFVKVNEKNVEVQIGEVLHPMVEEHYIQWVYLFTDKGGYWHSFKPGDTPSHTFVLSDGEIVKFVYENCNIHGLYVYKA